jgi:hypothetical protein
MPTAVPTGRAANRVPVLVIYLPLNTGVRPSAKAFSPSA